MANAGDPEYEYRFYEDGDDDAIFDILHRCILGWKTRTAAYWAWLHRDRPGFTPEDITVVECGGELVGCFHSVVVPLELDSGLELPVSFDGDFAVVPEHRRRGVPVRAHEIGHARLLDQGVVLRGGFTSKELNERFYSRRFGYVFIPTEAIDFIKALDPLALRHRVEKAGARLLRSPRLRGRLARKPLRVDLYIEGLAPAHVAMTDAGFRLCPGAAGQAEYSLRLPYRLLVAPSRGAVSFFKAASADVLRGRVRLWGTLRRLPTLLALLGAVVANRSGGSAGRARDG